MSEEFKIGDVVEWTSSSAGTTKTKRGDVFAVIPPGKDGYRQARKLFVESAGTHRNLWGGGLWRDEVSYVVEVPGATPKAKPILYWPRAAALKRV
jgi:hypothetical protein